MKELSNEKFCFVVKFENTFFNQEELENIFSKLQLKVASCESIEKSCYILIPEDFTSILYDTSYKIKVLDLLMTFSKDKNLESICTYCFLNEKNSLYSTIQSVFSKEQFSNNLKIS